MKTNNTSFLAGRTWAAGVTGTCLVCLCSLLSCGELCTVLQDGSCWQAPVGCTTPWGIAGPAAGAANVKQLDEFPSDVDWINVSGNGDAENPVIVVGSGVVTKMVKIREGSSYVVLDGLVIRPEPSKDYGWVGAAVLIEGGTHHIAVRNCTLTSTSDADPTTVPLHRTLLAATPSRGRSVEYVTVFNCTVGPLGDWTQNEGADHSGLMFPAGTKYVRVFDCSVSDIGGDAIGFPNETMLAARGGSEFPATDVQIGRCHLQRCKENLIDCKLVQGMIVSECTLSQTNAFSTSSRGDALSIVGVSQAILDENGGTLSWMSSNRVWLLFNDIRDVSRGAMFTSLQTVPGEMTGTLHSIGNTWTNINAEGRGSGRGLIAGNGNMVLSFNDTFSNVDIHTSSLPSGMWPAHMVVTQGQIPQEAFRQEFGRDLEPLP